jgi:hypothetical protein
MYYLLDGFEILDRRVNKIIEEVIEYDREIKERIELSPCKKEQIEEEIKEDFLSACRVAGYPLTIIEYLNSKKKQLIVPTKKSILIVL